MSVRRTSSTTTTLMIGSNIRVILFAHSLAGYLKRFSYPVKLSGWAPAIRLGTGYQVGHRLSGWRQQRDPEYRLSVQTYQLHRNYFLKIIFHHDSRVILFAHSLAGYLKRFQYLD